MKAVVFRFILLLVVLVTTESHAQTVDAESAISPRVVLVSLTECCLEEAWPEAEKRIRTEFSLLNLDVVITSGAAVDERDRRAELRKLAKKHNAACAVRIIKTGIEQGGGIELWVEDRVTGKTTFRLLELSDTATIESATITALRTVELLRASLLELKSPTHIEEKKSVPPEIEAILPEQEGPKGGEEKLQLGAGFSLLGSVGGTGPIGAVRFFAGWIPTPKVSLVLDGSVSVVGKDVEKEDASTTLDASLIRLWTNWIFLKRESILMSSGIAAGLAIVWVEGDSDVHDNVYSDTVATAYFGADLKTSVRLFKKLFIFLSIDIGGLVPKVNIDFADEEVAQFGTFLIDGTLGFEFFL